MIKQIVRDTYERDGLLGTMAHGDELTLSQTSPGFTSLLYKSFENTVGKREITPNEFLPVCKTFCQFSSKIKLPSTNTFSLEESQIC